ncbi:hypothetical protein Hdeb2414_s0018g00517311 [Helianthus debilis subsp. tardiflorus]
MVMVRSTGAIGFSIKGRTYPCLCALYSIRSPQLTQISRKIVAVVSEIMGQNIWSIS